MREKPSFFFTLCVFIVTLWSAYKNVRDKEKIYKKKRKDRKKKEVEKKEGGEKEGLGYRDSPGHRCCLIQLLILSFSIILRGGEDYESLIICKFYPFN
jgi:hypothetical protein